MTFVREGGNGNNGHHAGGRVYLGSRAGPGDSSRAHPRNAGITLNRLRARFRRPSDAVRLCAADWIAVREAKPAIRNQEACAMPRELWPWAPLHCAIF